MTTKTTSTPALLLLVFGVLMTLLVYQLKPTVTVVTERAVYNQPPRSTSSPDISLPSVSVRTTEEAPNTTPESEYLALDLKVASTLNELLLDYFTTPFGVNMQDKWQDRLVNGAPYLAELASYLKLDKLYGLTLYTEESQFQTNLFLEQRMQQTGKKVSSSENSFIHLSLFSFIDKVGHHFWPMTLVVSAESFSFTPKILLNNYDRDFVLKIERQHLAKKLAPLTTGIERLLRYHLSESVSNSAGLQTYLRTKNIDEVEREFLQEAPEIAELFSIYNLFIKREWHKAALFLQSSEHLNRESYRFLYDILAINAPEALLTTVNFEQYLTYTEWWDRFFSYELCIGPRQTYRTDINQRLSLALPCTSQNSISLAPVIPNDDSDELIELFWGQILNGHQVTRKSIEAHLLSVSPQQSYQYQSINSHTVMDFLARKDRIKVLRNAYLLQRIETNYQLWKQTMGIADGDSFYQFSALHHWFGNSRPQLQQMAYDDMPRLIPQTSPAIQKQIARELVDLIELGVITRENWSLYQSLVSELSVNEQYLINQFTKAAHWPLSKPNFNAGDIDAQTRQRLTEMAYDLLFSNEAYTVVDAAYDFDDFINTIASRMRTFSSRYPNAPVANDINLAFTDAGELSNHAMRNLSRTWFKAHPELTP